MTSTPNIFLVMTSTFAIVLRMFISNSVLRMFISNSVQVPNNRCQFFQYEVSVCILCPFKFITRTE